MIPIKAMEITDIGAEHDDSTMGANGGGSGGGAGMSLGNSSPVLNLDKTNQKEDPRASMSEEDIKAMYAGQEEARYPKETPEETKPSQGEQEQTIDNINRNIEKWNEYLDKNSIHSWGTFIDKLNKNEYEQFEKYLTDNNIKLNPNGNKNKETINAFINSLLGNYKDELYGIKTNEDYDPRTDQQRRDDTTIQRASEDYIKAGLNPKALSGYSGGGGGGGSSGSKSDEEEEKRKKRRKELEEIRRAKHAEKMREKELITGIVQSLTNTATKAVGAGAYMHNQNQMAQANQAHQKEMQQSSNIHSRYMIEAEKLAGNKKYRKGEDWY